MSQVPSLAAIRRGDIAAVDAWELLRPIVDTADYAVATQVCDVLRSWTWKTLDRRRRDAGLREWVDLLNRVEAFLESRFARLAAKVELLVELIHESLAVAELASPAELLRRKHVAAILTALEAREGHWTDRAELMEVLRLKPANMTRLMGLLADVGWVEQQVVNGREVAYRVSTEGSAQARALPMPSSHIATPHGKLDDPNLSQLEALLAPQKTLTKIRVIGLGDHAGPAYAREWEQVEREVIEALEYDDRDAEDACVEVPVVAFATPRLATVGGGW